MTPLTGAARTLVIHGPTGPTGAVGPMGPTGQRGATGPPGVDPWRVVRLDYTYTAPGPAPSSVTTNTPGMTFIPVDDVWLMMIPEDTFAEDAPLMIETVRIPSAVPGVTPIIEIINANADIEGGLWYTLTMQEWRVSVRVWQAIVMV